MSYRRCGRAASAIERSPGFLASGSRLWFECEGTEADRAAIAELGWEEFSRQLAPAEEFSAASALPLDGDDWRQFVEAYYERDEEIRDQKLQELYGRRGREKRTR